ncbi:MAG TPA: hypothetical protein VE842_12800 [Pyrinomonadaceae bacterium]|nr:hypothetical protein [Pyrinomonadaceae bacterium]
MMKKILLLSAIVLLLGFSTETFAQGYRHRSGRVNDRFDRQRIRRGIRSGQITREEARLLRERQRQIRAERRVYRSDGRLARDERREIRRDEREHDRLIRRARHNDDRRWDNRRWDDRRWRNNGRVNHRRGNGYYRRGAGSPTHPVFGRRGRRN